MIINYFLSSVQHKIQNKIKLKCLPKSSWWCGWRWGWWSLGKLLSKCRRVNIYGNYFPLSRILSSYGLNYLPLVKLSVWCLYVRKYKSNPLFRLLENYHNYIIDTKEQIISININIIIVGCVLIGFACFSYGEYYVQTQYTSHIRKKIVTPRNC